MTEFVIHAEHREERGNIELKHKEKADLLEGEIFPQEIVVWNNDAFIDNFVIKNDITKYLKKSC